MGEGGEPAKKGGGGLCNLAATPAVKTSCNKPIL